MSACFAIACVKWNEILRIINWLKKKFIYKWEYDDYIHSTHHYRNYVKKIKRDSHQYHQYQQN